MRFPVFWFRKVIVCGRSMEPNYVEGALAYLSPFSYWCSAPRRGDVVVLASPYQKGTLEIKRIVGLPNERIEWIGLRIKVNKEPLYEPYAIFPKEVPGDEDVLCYELKDEEYFVAGDNRLHSVDSRRYGPLVRKRILGKVLRMDKQKNP
jgi:signal peptidase I